MLAKSDDDETLLLKFVQSLDARNPLVEPFACVIERVPLENESGPENVVAPTAPLELVERSAFGVPIFKFVVDAVLKYPSPLAEMFVVLAPALNV